MTGIGGRKGQAVAHQRHQPNRQQKTKQQDGAVLNPMTLWSWEKIHFVTKLCLVLACAWPGPCACAGGPDVVKYQLVTPLCKAQLKGSLPLKLSPRRRYSSAEI